jgi:hypothetical protein
MSRLAWIRRLFASRGTSAGRRPVSLRLLPLEDRLTPAAPFPEFVDPNPNPGNQFGAWVVPLSTGNVIVSSAGDDANGTDTGAVYLFSGATGALISTLRGSTAGDMSVLFIMTLPNGNYLIRNQTWDNGGVVDAGAVTFANGTTGVSGVISAANSLVGSRPNDSVGHTTSNVGSVDVLTNGNYVVSSMVWDNGATQDVGAVTFGNGTTGVSGVISAANSLIGASAGDKVGGNGGARALRNGNYVVRSPEWDNGAIPDAGAVTFGNGTTGTVGVVSAANSLVGSQAQDQVGLSVFPLTNGNYVVVSSEWDNGAIANSGAVTFGDGTTGVVGVVSPANSLVGTSTGDRVGSVFDSFSGRYLPSISTLPNGNYLVRSRDWNNGAVSNAGAVTFGNGTTGVAGPVSAANSLVGSSANDQVGDFFPVIWTNGNYLIPSPNWNNGAIPNAGAVTFGSGTTGVAGAISAANSLVGSATNDYVGARSVGSGGSAFGSGVAFLSNGDYVVGSPNWDNGAIPNAGAVTLGNGTSGVVGVVSAANSLVGSSANDEVGEVVRGLADGRYLVVSPEWDDGATANVGAVTFVGGTTALTGVISAANSLIGSTAQDQVGSGLVVVLENGNYVVLSPEWDNGGIADAGAVTFGNGTTGVVGAVSAANSLIGSSAGDKVGLGVSSFPVFPLPNGNYVIRTPEWDNGGIADAGAVTFGNGTTGVTGVISAANSLIGATAGDKVGSGYDPFGTILENGDYFIFSPEWDNGGVVDAGAVTIGNGTTGIVGVVSAGNSLVGASAGDRYGEQTFSGIFSSTIGLANGSYLVSGRSWDNGAVADAGIVTFVNRQTGAVGVVTSNTPNSVFGRTANAGLDDVYADAVNNTFYVRFPTDGGGRVLVGSQADGFLTDVNLSVSANAGTEAAGTVITITATSNLPVVGDQAITLSVSGAGITAGDYALSSVTITIPHGQTTGSVTYTVLNDTVVEGIETATVTLTNPSGNITLGTVVTQTITITSDDVPPASPPPPVVPPVFGPPVIGPGLIPPILIRPPVSPPPVALPSLPSPVVPPSSGVFLRAVGAGVGGEPRVRVYNADGSERFSVLAYDAAFRGGVSVATADVTGDGVDDLITAAGAGGGPHVKVFDGQTGGEVMSFFAYDPAFAGGVSVAADDVNGDGVADVVTGAGAGGGPHVKVFDGRTGGELASFFAYDPAFAGGVNVAVGDVNGDGRADVVTGAGAGGGPHVKVVNASALGQTNADGTIADTALLANFMAFALAFGGGVNVSAGDFDGDGLADVGVGAGAGGRPHVRVVSATGLSRTNADGGIAADALLADFSAFEEEFRGGVRVGVADGLPGGGSGLILGAGPGGGPRVRVLRADGLGVVEDFFADAPEFAGGVFVG